MKLVETKWQTGPTASPEKAYHAFYSSFHINATAPIQEISDVLHAAMMSEESYSVIENRIFEMVGAEGKFSGDVADALKVTQTKLKALVKRSPRLPREDLLIVVGAEKVPRELFDLVQWNVAVGNQPHSEVAALAIFLDRLLGPSALGREFTGPLRIRPSPRGKDVVESDT